jgi:hypothetical protein
VGDDMVLKIGTRKTTWKVVGITQGTLSGPIAFANYAYAAKQTRTYGRADRVLGFRTAMTVRTSPRSRGIETGSGGPHHPERIRA